MSITLKIKKNKYGQIHKSDLTDKEWNHIKDYLPYRAKTDRPRSDDRQVINGILYFLSATIRWNDMPKYYPSGITCWRRLKEYDELGIWGDILDNLQNKALNLGKLNLNNGYIDGSLAESKKGGAKNKLFRKVYIV